MKIKVSETTNLQLNWMVAKAGKVAVRHKGNFVYYAVEGGSLFNPVKQWALGGPIIAREHIGLSSPMNSLTMFWTADIGHERKFTQLDHDPLIAAMRCYVVSKLGDEVEVPDEL